MSQALAVIDKPQVPAAKGPDPITTLSAYLRTREGKIAEIMPKALAKTMSPHRLITIAMAAASRNQDLLKCSPESIYLALHHSAQLGLEAGGPLGHFYLVPRWNSKAGRMECTSVIGYKGLAELCRRSGEISRIDAAVAYEGEHFAVRRGLAPDLEHVWDITVPRTPEKVVAAYAVLVTKDGATYFEVLTRAQIEERRAKSSSNAKGGGPWASDYAAMCRKSALRALLAGGLVPLSTDLAVALEEDIRSEDAEDPAAPAAPEQTDDGPKTQTDQVKDALKKKGAKAKRADSQPTPEPRQDQPQDTPTEMPELPDLDEEEQAGGPSQEVLTAHSSAAALIDAGQRDRWLTEMQANGFRKFIDEKRDFGVVGLILEATARLDAQRKRANGKAPTSTKSAAPAQETAEAREPGTEG